MTPSFTMTQLDASLSTSSKSVRRRHVSAGGTDDADIAVVGGADVVALASADETGVGSVMAGVAGAVLAGSGDESDDEVGTESEGVITAMDPVDSVRKSLPQAARVRTTSAEMKP
jgi:hypothetical protein